MRKILCLFFAIILVSCVLGCTKQKNSDENNNVFTDAFFSEVIEIRDSRFGVVSAEQIAPVAQYLKGLELTASDTYLTTVNENGEILDGCDVITFLKRNGEKVIYLRNHAKFSIFNVCSYVVSDGENINIGLKNAYSQAINKSAG